MLENRKSEYVSYSGAHPYLGPWQAHVCTKYVRMYKLGGMPHVYEETSQKIADAATPRGGPTK
jgi:hypothetical protein